jgi:hypothetical protein
VDLALWRGIDIEEWCERLLASMKAARQLWLDCNKAPKNTSKAD